MPCRCFGLLLRFSSVTRVIFCLSGSQCPLLKTVGLTAQWYSFERQCFGGGGLDLKSALLRRTVAKVNVLQVVSFEEILKGGGSIAALKPVSCPQHVDEHLNFFCNICQVSYCGFCKNGRHILCFVHCEAIFWCQSNIFADLKLKSCIKL